MKPRQPLFIALTIFLFIAFAGSITGLYNEDFANVFNNLIAIIFAIFIIVCLLDRFVLSNKRLPAKIERILPQHIVLERDTPIKLRISSNNPKQRLPIPMKLADRIPPDWTTPTPEINIDLNPPSPNATEITYTANAHRRGVAMFDGVDMAIPSQLGLWWITFQQTEKVEVKVLPDFVDIFGSDLYGFNRWLQMIGIKKNRRRGEGQDFFQLREFTNGDDIRHIHWKATARTGKPIVRTFHDERDRQIVFLLDCSRQMDIVSGSRTHLDHAMTAMLLLTYTAIKHEDSVGVMTYNSHEDRFLPPHSGIAQIGKIINTIYDIEPTTAAADLENAIERIIQQQKRRAWIIILTHLDCDNDQAMINQLIRLSRHHPILFVNLRQTSAEDIANTTINNHDEALTYLGAQHYIQEEQRVLTQIAASHISHLNVLPEQLTSNLINHYLQLKRSGSL